MTLRYYPQTQIKQNLYTRGGQLTLVDGTNYSGRYYVTSDGKAYTGINPAIGTNQLLIPATIKTTNTTNNITSTTLSLNPAIVQATSTSGNLNPISSAEASVLTKLNPYYPVPLDTDYQRGYFTRYFAKYVTGPGYVVEVSEADWTKIQNGQVSTTSLGYESTSILWQLTGPLHNTRVSQYQVKGGVYDTNKRTTETAAVGFIGLKAFIGEDYTKFAQITSGSVATSGSM
jgi:hypothetical protein